MHQNRKYHELDVNNWKRREHFHFLSNMANPFFRIVTEVDCTSCYEQAKLEGVSFFARYMHESMVAVNAVEELRYRIVDGRVLVFDAVHVGTTIARSDGTFGFAHFDFDADFELFNKALQKEIQAVQESSGLRLQNGDLGADLIRHSTFPWSSFSGLLHPTNHDKSDSIPKITFGKATLKEGKRMLPVSIEAHHGLLDGLHLAQYLELFQEQLNR